LEGESHELQAMESEPLDRRISMRDIAKVMDISHAAVSLALRDSPSISAKLREAVKQRAEELGYCPDPMLSALSNYRLGKSRKTIRAAIGWVNAWKEPEQLRSFKEFDFYWKGATAAANKHGFRIEEFRLGEQYTPHRLHQILSARGIRGLLLPPQSPQPDWGDFPWEEYSVVRFGRSLNHPRCHLVTADQVANTMLAFAEIRERGYRRIGFATHEVDLQISGHLFEGGYLTAQRLVDESERLPVFAMNDFPVAERKEALAAWLKANNPDAILTTLSEIQPMLESIGVRVPEDVALAGSTVLDIPIDAGIDQHPEEIGRVGLLMLNSIITDGARGIPNIFRQNLVEGSWVDGKSLPDKRVKSKNRRK
jgi:LacI family transcriptional regulator